MGHCTVRETKSEEEREGDKGEKIKRMKKITKQREETAIVGYDYFFSRSL